MGTGLDINTVTPGRRGSFSSQTNSQALSYEAVPLLGVPFSLKLSHTHLPYSLFPSLIGVDRRIFSDQPFVGTALAIDTAMPRRRRSILSLNITRTLSYALPSLCGLTEA